MGYIKVLIPIVYICSLIIMHLSILISKLFQRSLILFEDMLSNGELLSLLNQILAGLFNGILSAFDKENHFEETDPDGGDPDGDDSDGDEPHGPGPSGDDPNNSGSSGDGPNRDDDNHDQNKSDTDMEDSDTDMEDSDTAQKVDKGKQRAITPEFLPEKPITYEQPTGSEYDSEENFMRDIERAKLNSLKEQTATGESSKQSAHSGFEEQDVKIIKDQYNKAVEEFNDNQIQIVDNNDLDPAYKQHLIELSKDLREKVEYYRALKDEFGAYSSEEDSPDDYSEDSDYENNRSSKRPRND
jgi:hypothetical protein